MSDHRSSALDHSSSALDHWYSTLEHWYSVLDHPSSDLDHWSSAFDYSAYHSSRAEQCHIVENFLWSIIGTQIVEPFLTRFEWSLTKEKGI